MGNSSLWTVVLACAITLGASDAWAKRLGSGLSFGKQSGNVTQSSSTAPAAAPAPRTAAAQPAGSSAAPAAAPGRAWGGMLGGLAAGLGLAWLASSLGFGEAFGQFLLFALVGAVILAVIALVLRRRSSNASSSAGLAFQAAASGDALRPVSPRSYSPLNVGNDASARPWETQASDATDAAADGGLTPADGQPWGVPENFDTAAFLQASKANFIHLQSAWDRSDIPALRAMMTDDMLQQIQAQLAERERLGASGSQTDVVMLDARLLGIETLQEAYMASVEFSGLIRDDASAGPNPFCEVWNITRPRDAGGGWLVAGVQALS